MSSDAYFVLINRVRLESEVTPLITDALAGRTNEALHILKSKQTQVAMDLDLEPKLDVEPLMYFSHCVQLAIDTIEGRKKSAFVNEITPLITDPEEAWRHNVNILVRSGLALSMCAARPEPGLLGSFWFRFRPSALISEWSPTAREAADHDDPLLVEPTRVGVFDEPEMFLTRTCLERILDEIQPLVQALPTLSEKDETIQAVSHFYSFVSAPMRSAELAILRGYL